MSAFCACSSWPGSPPTVPDDVTALSAAELLDAFARRTLDPVEVAEATLAADRAAGAGA